MKSKWKITSQYFDDVKLYAVYRLRDVDKTDHSGNREFAGEYTGSKAEAEALVAGLNEIQEVQNGRLWIS